MTFILLFQDHMYLIKTITTEEVEQMHYLLKNYHPYIVEQHGKTLLPQFLGKQHVFFCLLDVQILIMIDRQQIVSHLAKTSVWQ